VEGIAVTCLLDIIVGTSVFGDPVEAPGIRLTINASFLIPVFASTSS